MNSIVKILRKIKLALMLFLASAVFTCALQIKAHGDEDHSGDKPKTTASQKGTVSHTARLGEYELMLKHPQLRPDMTTAARLFITKFETNEAADNAVPAIEIESANNSVTQAIVEKNDAGGSYTVKIPALPQGNYIVRARLTYNGETDTATFSGVQIAPEATDGTENELSWARRILIGTIFSLVLALFGGLVYFVWRNAEGESVNEKTVSA